MENDIRNLRQALSVLEEVTKIQKVPDVENIFREKMKQKLFPYGCSKNCYYR